MEDFMPGTTSPDEIFSQDIRDLIKRDSLDHEEQMMEQSISSFDPKMLRDEMALQVGKSLGVGEDFLNSDDGQKTLYEIADFLEKERNVDQLNMVSSALVSVINNLMIPQQAQYPEGVASRLKDYLMSRKVRNQNKEEMDSYGKLWGTKPLP